jgi:hypothetical protein
MKIIINDACTVKVSLALASVINYSCKCDATIWSVNLMTLESSVMIIICL